VSEEERKEGRKEGREGGREGGVWRDKKGRECIHDVGRRGRVTTEVARVATERRSAEVREGMQGE
jgi:hypothetical protein